MQTTPVSLLKRLREANQPEDWKRFVELYTPVLYYWATRLGLQQADAADLVQDVLVICCQKLPEFTYDRQKSFRGWLRTVLVNKHREMLRRRRETTLPPDAAPLEDLAAPAGDDPLGDKEYQQLLVSRALQLMQKDFRPTTWRACWETTVGDKSPAEVADELGISLRAVYLARIRVLQRLRQELEGLLE
jgi:RNA polymerase sigma-70 factor, ECF subfamily